VAASPVVLETKNVTRVYPEADGGTLLVLDRVNLSVARGEMVSLLGPSGSGKTTLLQICGLLDRASDGDVEIAGLSTCRLARGKLTEIRKNAIGFAYQSHHLLPEFSALENVELPLRVIGLAKGEAERRALETLERLGMAEKRANMPAELSGGERQRVALARAVVTRPAVLLADEPTGNLDDSNSQRVLDLLRNILKAYNSSMLIVTHDRELAWSMDRALVMENHRVIPAPSGYRG
jgi:lipoprotein-releasing system ATP-binding protein